MLKVGDKVRWAAPILAHGEPMRVVAVHPATKQLEIHSGSRVAMSQIELVESAPEEDASPFLWDPRPKEDNDGMLEVVEAQMEALDALSKKNARAEQAILDMAHKMHEVAYEQGAFEAYREIVRDRVGRLCISLGFDRVPLVETGLPELDGLVRFLERDGE